MSKVQSSEYITCRWKKRRGKLDQQTLFLQKKGRESKLYMYSFGKQRHIVYWWYVIPKVLERMAVTLHTTTHSSKEIYLGWQIASFFTATTAGASWRISFLGRRQSSFYVKTKFHWVALHIISHSIIYGFKAKLMTYWTEQISAPHHRVRVYYSHSQSQLLE